MWMITRLFLNLSCRVSLLVFVFLHGVFCMDGFLCLGAIPAEMGKLGNLKWLYLNGNQLAGKLYVDVRVNITCV
jgi:hypothetical protein